MSSLPRVTRRDAMRLLGGGAGFGVLSALRPDRNLAAGPLQTAVRGRQLTFPRRAVVRTLLKDIPSEALAGGVTLFHEHLSIKLPPAQPRPANAPPPQPPPTDNVDLIIELVKAAARDGVTCIVDGGHPDMGRDLAAVRRIALQTSVHIVASGGYYMQRTYPPDLATKSDDQIADDLAREATENRYGSFGEIGQMPDMAEMTPDERKTFRAVGKAHVRTGLPIFTHNAYGTGPNVPKEAGLRQLDVLEAVGVKPHSIAIGHSCCLDDPKAEVFRQIAKRGAFVGFDRVTTVQRIMPDDKKVQMVLALLDAGFADKLLLSADFTGQRTLEEGPGYGRTVTVFAPLLRKAGVKEDVLQGILVDNPRRFLAFVPVKA